MDAPGLGKISTRYFAIGAENKIWRAVLDQGVSSRVYFGSGQ